MVSQRPIGASPDPNADVYIGQSEVAMWMRVVSSWVCMLLYTWSLIAPVLLPDRYVLLSGHSSVNTHPFLGLVIIRFSRFCTGI